MDDTIYIRADQLRKRKNGNRSLIIINPDGKMREIFLDSFRKENVLIGRDSDKCDIVLPFDWVSRVHGKFILRDEWVYFADADSRYGVILDMDGCRRFIKGNKKFYLMQSGDVLRIQAGQSDLVNSVMLLFADGRDTGVWKRCSLSEGIVMIGRESGNNIVLSHPGVSRLHAVIKRQGDGFVLTDNGSMNGTFVNGLKLGRSRRLAEKDVIQILSSTLIYTRGTILYRSSVSGISIEVDGVSKFAEKQKKKILDQVSCRVESNEFVAVTGGTDADRTAFMNVMSGADQKVQGDVRYNGISLRKNFNGLKNLIGYVPQENVLYENLTLRDMLYFTARIRMLSDTSGQEIERRIDQVLAMAELSGCQDMFIRKLSAGQKKRAGIAVELLSDPGVFFLNEPVAGLDPGAEQKLMMTLSRLSGTQGKTIVMAARTAQNLQLCDKVIFLGEGGRLCFCGTLEQAKKFFHTGNLADIYSMISDNSEFWVRKYAEVSARKDERIGQRMQGNSSVSIRRPEKHLMIGQMPLLLLRYIKLIVNDFPGLLLLFVWPVVLVLFLAAVAGRDVFVVYEDTKAVLISLSCAAMWTGLSDSIWEIRGERAVLKSEYRSSLKLPCYILSKFLVQTLIGFIQALLIVLVFTVTVGSPEAGILSDAAFPETLVTVWLTIEASMGLGLVISALMKSAAGTMISALSLLFVQLLFSGILSETGGAGRYIACATIGKWSVESLGSTADLNSLRLRIQGQLPAAVHETEKIFEHTKEHLYGNWRILLGVLLVCAAVYTFTLRRLLKDTGQALV